jgi:ABC-type antimicrobial peptide transport system ATPase subunit
MPLRAPKQILAALLDGTPVAEIQVALDRLPLRERYSVLCRACKMHEEIKQVCIERAEQIASALSRNCPFRSLEGKYCGRPMSER